MQNYNRAAANSDGKNPKINIQIHTHTRSSLHMHIQPQCSLWKISRARAKKATTTTTTSTAVTAVWRHIIIIVCMHVCVQGKAFIHLLVILAIGPRSNIILYMFVHITYKCASFWECFQTFYGRRCCCRHRLTHRLNKKCTQAKCCNYYYRSAKTVFVCTILFFSKRMVICHSFNWFVLKNINGMEGKSTSLGVLRHYSEFKISTILIFRIVGFKKFCWIISVFI